MRKVIGKAVGPNEHALPSFLVIRFWMQLGLLMSVLVCL